MSRITVENYDSSYLLFGERQAGISLSFCPAGERFYYHVYCLELTLMKELFSSEHVYLEDAVHFLDQEFGTWELRSYDPEGSGGCGSCVAK